MPDNSRNSVMFAVPTILIDSFLTKAGIVVFSLIIQAELFSIHSRFSERSECVVGAKRKLRFLYCITSQNTFIQCQPRMNRALAERCTVRPKTSCRASYATNSRPTSWPVTLKPGESACRATPATAIRRAPNSPIVGHSSSGPSPSRSSAFTCRALMTPASGNANLSAPGPCRSGVSNNVSL